MIKLGSKVKDKYTGFVGIAVSKTEFINGCIQYGVVPKVKRDNVIVDEIGIDEDSLTVISEPKIIAKKKKKDKKDLLGGPNTRLSKRRNF